MRIRLLGRVLLLAALAAAVALQAGAGGPEDLLHHAAPAFVRNDLAQRRVELAAYRGKVVLLNFWATWCAPCQVELPKFAEWQRSFGPRGFQVIAVSMDDDAAPVRGFLRRRPMPFPVVMGDDRLGTEYGGILGLPVTFLIDRHGVVVAHFKGEPHLDRMEAEVRRLLNER